MKGLVLSLFPGIGLLDRAFEEEGFCVVRGPDLLWGGNIKRFHPPAGRFDGVIGGPPCQCFSRLVHIVRHNGYRVGENLVPEYESIIREAQPTWWVMENVVEAPIPAVEGYIVDPSVLDNRWLGEVQSRKHRFSFGTRDGRRLHYATMPLEACRWERRVTTNRREAPNSGQRSRSAERGGGPLPGMGKMIPLSEACVLQGLPEDFFGGESPFKITAARTMLGNGVPLPMGRALAATVARAIADNEAAA